MNPHLKEAFHRIPATAVVLEPRTPPLVFVFFWSIFLFVHAFVGQEVEVHLDVYDHHGYHVLLYVVCMYACTWEVEE